MFLTFPFVYLHLYLLYGFLLGMILSFVDIWGYGMSLIPYMIYVIFLIVLATFLWRGFTRIRLGILVLVSTFWFIAQVAYFGGMFFIPRQGWQGWSGQRLLSQHNDNYWYFLGRSTPLYPFQPIGIGLVGDGFKTPGGYFSVGKTYSLNSQTGKYDKYLGSNLVPYWALAHMAIFSVLHSAFFLVILNKKLHKEFITTPVSN